MGIKIEKLANEHIIIIHVLPPIDINNDPTDATNATLEFQKEIKGKICRITDYTEVKLTFSDVVMGMKADTIFKHPDVKSVIVGDDKMVEMAAKSFKQEQYGGIDVPFVKTREEAIQKAHELIK